MSDSRIIIASSDEEFSAGKTLFLEYAAAIGVDLSFQNFEEELKEMRITYAHPYGALLLLKDEDKYLGCAGIRKFDGGIAELKRMYLKECCRGKGLGTILLNHAVDEAWSLGYVSLRLDTLPFMKQAMQLYTRAGFQEIPAYRFNPVAGSKYFEIHL